LEPNEYVYTQEHKTTTGANWALSMVEDEIEKRHQSRFLDVIHMTDALLIDAISAFSFPYAIVGPDDRYFLQSQEWERYVRLQVPCERRWIWETPLHFSIVNLCKLLQSLYERQSSLRVIFHLPRPCFNDGVTFANPVLTANVDYYHHYTDRLYSETSRRFPRVSVISCGGEQADPCHYNYPNPFHYDGNYLAALRREIERLLE
jgi:hypothetical protein